MAENPIKTTPGKTVFKCDVCFKHFNSKSNLKTHSRVHSGEKPYFCKVCFESFGHYSTMKSHLQSHSKERKFVCHVCHKSYVHDRTLKDHMRTHVPTDLLCQFCDKKLADPTSLKRHILTHVPDESLTCKVCNKSFTRRINLQKHNTKFHSNFRQTFFKMRADRLASEQLSISNGNSVAVSKMIKVPFHNSDTVENLQATELSQEMLSDFGDSNEILMVTDQVTSSTTSSTTTDVNSSTDCIQSPFPDSITNDNVRTIFIPDVLSPYLGGSEEIVIFSSTSLNLTETGSTDASIPSNPSNDEVVKTVNLPEESFHYFDDSSEVTIDNISNEILPAAILSNESLSSFPEPDERILLCKDLPDVLDLDSENLNPIISESDVLQSILDTSNTSDIECDNADSLQLEDEMQENIFSDSISDKVFFIPSSELPRTEVELLIGSEALIDDSLCTLPINCT